jgi:Asp-tRNA(Asn)/Glu-tRNA(Gln) amidotransferase C subunit
VIVQYLSSRVRNVKYTILSVGIEGTAEEKWVRARIIAEDCDEVVLWSIDACEELTVSKENIRQLPKGLFYTPALGTRCTTVVPDDGVEREDVEAKCGEAKEILNKTEVAKDGYVVEVKLEDLGKDVVPAIVYKNSDDGMVEILDYVICLPFVFVRVNVDLNSQRNRPNGC